MRTVKTSFGLNKHLDLIVFPGTSAEVFSLFSFVICVQCYSQFPVSQLLLNRTEGSPQRIMSYFYVLGSLLLRIIVNLKSRSGTGG